MNKCWLFFPVALLLSACGGNSIDDVKEWMDGESKNIRPSITPIPKTAEYRSVDFNMQGRLDPFDTTRFDPTGPRIDVGALGIKLLEERERRNSLLERYPLESLRLIGIMNINNQKLAAIKVDNMVQQVKIGDFIGTDFGLITEIKESEISLKETVEDPANGDWVERMNTLYLQTKEEGK